MPADRSKAHCSIVITTGNAMALPARSCISASEGFHVSNMSRARGGLQPSCRLLQLFCPPFGCAGSREAPTTWPAPALVSASLPIPLETGWLESLGYSKPSRPSSMRAFFTCPAGSTQTFIFWEHGGRNVLSNLSFQVAALARPRL